MAEDRIEFTGLNLVCSDIEATVGFYRLLGVAIPEATLWRTGTGVHHVPGVEAGGSSELEFDSPDLARLYNAGFETSPTPAGVVIGFRVPSRNDVDRLYAVLIDAGHTSRQAPFDPFWGARYAIVADPDGRDVGLMSPSDPDRRTAPPPL
jgi:catechol 2,3-dioxygenase-like lactoylglutathione lyase family enzyme